MKTQLRIRVIAQALLLWLIVAANSMQAQQGGSIRISIRPVWHGKPLILGRQQYITAHGDSLYIDAFKFYLSALAFTGHDKNSSEPNSYHLVNAEDSSTLTFVISNLPAGSYAALGLSIGIDSLANTSGALDGDLDPVKGMYWAWNTGYIHAKTEGRSGACKTLHHAFELHIGGYLPPYNALRKVTLQLPGLQVKKNGQSRIELQADLAAWFNGAEQIDISKTNSVVMPGRAAMLVADNYARMLSIIKISNAE